MKLLIIAFIFTFFNPAYADNKTSISHSHNGRTHSHPLPVSGKNHTHNSGGKQEKNNTNNEFGWLERTGWVSMYQVCRLNQRHGNNRSRYKNCKTLKINPVTETSFFSSWGGELTGMYYNNKYSNLQKNFTGKVRIKVTWTTGDKYKCGQLIEKYKSNLKDFKYRSIKMKKCKN